MGKFIVFPVLLALIFPLAGSAQERPPLVERYGDLESEVLYGIKQVVTRGAGIAVLTRPEPAVHLFGGGEYRAWGREGGGPQELAEPVDLAWTDNRITVLDIGHRKLVSYDAAGSFLDSRTLPGVWADRLYVVGTDTVLSTFVPMGEERAVIRLRGDARDTLLTYATTSDQIRLVAAGAPSLTLAAPFTPQSQWTLLADGSMAHWDPGVGVIRLLDRDGRATGALEEPGGRAAVTPADREHWLAEAIPSEFAGRRGVFEPLRREARDVVEFPDRFPPVLALEGDPGGGVWIRKTTAGSGEVWVLLSETGARLGSLRLPAGARLLRVGEAGLVASNADDFGVERIEVYRRPAWAGG